MSSRRNSTPSMSNICAEANSTAQTLWDTKGVCPRIHKTNVEISNIADKDRLFFFLDGLQPWINKELVGQNVKDLNSAIALAEKLLEGKRNERDRGEHRMRVRPKVGKGIRIQRVRRGTSRTMMRKGKSRIPPHLLQ